MIRKLVATGMATTGLLIPMAKDAGCGSSHGGKLPPNMIVNGRTKITKPMIGQVYHTKGPTDSAKAKGLHCEWRIIGANGVGTRFRIANGPMSVKFLKPELNGVFDSRFCRLWILLVKEN